MADTPQRDDLNTPEDPVGTDMPGGTALAEEDPDAPALREADLVEAIEQHNVAEAFEWLDRATTSEAVHALSALSDTQRTTLLTELNPEDAAEIIEVLPEPQAIDALEELEPEVAAHIIEELPSDDRADLIRALDEDDAEAIIFKLDEIVASEVRRLAAYDEQVTGSLMITEYLAFPEDITVRDVLADLEENADRYVDFNIQYSYVIDDEGRLHGVLPLRNLLMARRAKPVADIMIANPISVRDTTSIEDLRAVFADHPFIGLPVVNEDGALLGVVEQSHVAEAAADEADEVYRQTQGIIGGEELRSMPLLLRSRRRLAWLSVNILLNIVAASVIAMHQETLEAVIALAVFLPIISDMSGCSGNQAVAVSMRELTLGVTRPTDVVRVLVKEVSVGLLNGIALGILIGGVAYFWKGNIYLSGVVGVALAMNTIVAVCIGGLVPLILKGFKTDPALASGPILTTVTDMCGFLIVLSIASALMNQLVAAGAG